MSDFATGNTQQSQWEALMRLLGPQEPVAGLQPPGSGVLQPGKTLGDISPKNTDLLSQESLFGEAGWAMPALQTGMGLFNGWMGMQQLDLAKDQFKENRRQFDMNWGAQKNLTNNRLQQAQAVRASANPNAQPVDEYMAQWGVK